MSMTLKEIQTKAKVWRMIGEMGFDEALLRLEGKTKETCKTCYGQGMTLSGELKKCPDCI